MWCRGRIDASACDTRGSGRGHCGPSWFKPAPWGPSDTHTRMHVHRHTPSLQRFSGGPTSHNASVTRRSRRFLCPAAPWIRKVLAPLSDRVSRIDLNILTCLVPGGAYLFTPDPWTPGSSRSRKTCRKPSAQPSRSLQPCSFCPSK